MCLVLGRGQYSSAATPTPTRRLIMHVLGGGAPLTFCCTDLTIISMCPLEEGCFELLIWGRVPASPHPCRSAIWDMSWEPLIWPLGGLMLRALGTSSRISGDSMKQRTSRSPGWEGLFFCTGSKFPRFARRRRRQERCSPGRPGGYPGWTGIPGGGRLESEVWPAGPWHRAGLFPRRAEEPGRAAGGELAGDEGARSQGGQRPGAEGMSAGPTPEQVEEAGGVCPSRPLPATTSRCRHCPAKAAGASVL